MGPRDRHMRRRAKTHVVPIVLASFFGFLLIFGLAFGIGMLGNVNRWLQNLPDYTNADSYLSSEPTTVLDAKGRQLARFFTQNRKSIKMKECSKFVLNGTVATEDERFYQHGGIDPIGIARAAWVQLTGGSEGASTISQQLVRNTILSDEQFDKTIERKVREAYLAVKMEDIFSKDDILMMYLNTIYYGHGAYGIEAAAQTYYTKSAKDLTLSEAALLVGLPNSPATFDPTTNPELATKRRNVVLDRMLKNDYISQADHDAAQAEPLNLHITENKSNGVEIDAAPYFVSYIKDELQEKYSFDKIFKGGLTIKTSLDLDTQAAAEEAVVGQLNKVNVKDLQAGMTALDSKTGYIKAMVGGRDYNADERHVNHALAGRQTGSSFKAFTLATAIKNGMNPNILLNCNSGIRVPNGTSTYTVRNYGNTNYGSITLRRATEVSSNAGYVQAELALGNSAIVDYCSKVGIDISNTNKNAPAMTLGVESLSTLQMAGAYTVFPTGGYYREPTAVVEIDGRDGNVLYKHTDDPKKVLDTGVCQVVTDILKGVITSGTGASARLSVDQPFSGKTGTTDNAADLYFCGYTPQLTIAVWSGYTAGNTPIKIRGREALGDDLTLPMARNFLNKALNGVEREEFPTGTAPTYKSSSVWEIDGKKIALGEWPSRSGANTNRQQKSDNERESSSDQQPQTNPASPDTTPSPSTPNPPSPNPPSPNPPSPDPTSPDTKGQDDSGDDDG
ncbi:penicillin-binding protein, 1A family [Coriobacterium glomerans PW2]|uniref:Penicillin-binding protein, 1A family n=1 Tax=Coriobacterium glomerans (strain ATCC 49209 / DSM 20642 / JCM 10262 / PW2) TaxID=700015 RepID=F2N8L2_CORGP|nr:PBP1A family penicillin-binding protein [Coriobacterium glomerans]AEB07395.1 penicillin-binding protein, 1A family [Coriobacterium glomerans PW2]